MVGLTHSEMNHVLTKIPESAKLNMGHVATYARWIRTGETNKDINLFFPNHTRATLNNFELLGSSLRAAADPMTVEKLRKMPTSYWKCLADRTAGPHHVHGCLGGLTFRHVLLNRCIDAVAFLWTTGDGEIIIHEIVEDYHDEFEALRNSKLWEFFKDQRDWVPSWDVDQGNGEFRRIISFIAVDERIQLKLTEYGLHGTKLMGCPCTPIPNHSYRRAEPAATSLLNSVRVVAESIWTNLKYFYPDKFHQGRPTIKAERLEMQINVG